VRVPIVDKVSTGFLRPVPSAAKADNDAGSDLLAPIATPGTSRILTAADGTRLHVRIYGPKSGRPIVLAHGWTCSTEFWRAQINAFSGKYRVITYDQRGHGLSETGKSRFSTDILADDLSLVLKSALRPSERALLVGHSMGGMTIMAWAERYPDEVRKRASGAMLLSTGADSLLAEQLVLPLMVTRSPVGSLIAGNLLSAQVPIRLVPGPLVRYATMGANSTPEQVAFCHSIVAKCPTRVRGRWGHMLGRMHIVEALKSLNVPTTVLVGTSDRLTPPSHAARLADVLSKAGHLSKYVEVPEVGHMTPVEAAELVNTEIQTLLGVAAGQRRAG
jgi:pimeloyl-ACP methyl ester carboxylesterase